MLLYLYDYPFKCSDTQSLFSGKRAVLSGAERRNDLRVPPGNRLEKLSGNRKERYSIVSVLMLNGEFVLALKMVRLMMLKWWIVIERG